MLIEHQVALRAYNSFGIAARAQRLVRVRSAQDVRQVLDSEYGQEPKFILGGGSNIVLTKDVKALVLKVENLGRRYLGDDATHWVIEAEAGENWHDLVAWTIDQGWSGLENLALIPGTVGAAPVQNIGAYGVELQDRFDSLTAIDMETGREFELRSEHCAFGYRDSVFKHGAGKRPTATIGLSGRALILRVRFRLPKRWVPVLDYQELERKRIDHPTQGISPRQVFDWVCEIRRGKLPNPAEIGNVGSFFKNPSVSPEQCVDIIGREPNVVYHTIPDGSIKLAAASLIDACGWRGKSIGNASVYHRHALVLINKSRSGQLCTGAEVMTLARAIQTSVYERFGIMLEPEPVVI